MKIGERIVCGHGDLKEVAYPDSNYKYSVHNYQVAFDDILSSIELNWIKNERFIKIQWIILFIDWSRWNAIGFLDFKVVPHFNNEVNQHYYQKD